MNEMAPFRLERINRILFSTLGQMHVPAEFIERLGNFLATKDLFTFGSEEFNIHLGDFLDDGPSNRDNLFELVIAYYSNLILDGIRNGDFKPLAENIVGVKEDLPIDPNLRDLLGPREFTTGKYSKGYDVYLTILYLLKLQYTSLLDYALRIRKENNGKVKN